MPQPHPQNPNASSVPVGVLLPPAATATTATAVAWKLGVLLTTYTRPGDLVVTNDPSVYSSVTGVAGQLDRLSAILRRHPFAPHAPRALRPAALMLAWLPYPGRHYDVQGLTDSLRTIRDQIAANGYLIATPDGFGLNSDFDYPAEYATTLVTAARAAGYVYHQHLIALDAPPPQNPPAGPTTERIRHRRIHTDLYVFAASPRPEDGEARG